MTCSIRNTARNAAERVFQPARRLDGLSAYKAPESGPLVDLVLDANEGRASSGSLRDVLDRFDATDLARYPNASALERAIASRFGIASGRVVVTNGADDAIDRICRVSLEKGRALLTHSPSFEMIERSATLAGASVRTIRWMGGRFPASRFLSKISQETSLVALVSPNNPTGGVIDRESLREIIAAARTFGALVMLDLAYIEFADGDPTIELLEKPNVVLVRTFSKALGLAGARVGYSISSLEIADWIRTVGGPYPVSSVSLALASPALDAEAEQKLFIDQIRSERESLSDLLLGFGCEVLESQANFVTARFTNAAFVRRSLAALGIAVRSFPNRDELDGFLRISLPGDKAAFDRLRTSLRTILDPQAILFDLDGVLADVSDSYRQAIVETARSFGITLSLDEISAAKHAGNANNDWELTHRLLEQRGVRCGLGEVTKRFQNSYLGSQDNPGLRESERFLTSRPTLERLGDRYRLGIVTGRPRTEAEWFLRRAGVRELFEAMVCMEDAPAKPAADPVLLAMEQLSAERAWMLGDTPDDIASARKADVLPLGVLAPGDGERAIGAMEVAGAAIVLERVGQLEEIIK